MLVLLDGQGFKDKCPLLDNAKVRKRIVSQAMQHSEESENTYAFAFREFHNQLHIDGFRRGKVPKQQKIQVMSKFSDVSSIILHLVLSAWQEANDDLFKLINVFLEEQGLDDVQKENLSEDSAEYIYDLKQRFLDENEQVNETDAELMLWYRLYGEFEETIEAEEISNDVTCDEKRDISKEHDRHDYSFCDTWNKALTDLKHSKLGSPQCLEFESFVEYAKKILSKKSHEAQKVNYAWNAFVDIQKRFSERIRFLELEWLNDLGQENHSVFSGDDFVDVVAQIGECLEKYEILRQSFETPAQKKSEEKEQFRIKVEQLDPLEGKIVDLAERLADLVHGTEAEQEEKDLNQADTKSFSDHALSDKSLREQWPGSVIPVEQEKALEEIDEEKGLYSKREEVIESEDEGYSRDKISTKEEQLKSKSSPKDQNEAEPIKQAHSQKEKVDDLQVDLRDQAGIAVEPDFKPSYEEKAIDSTEPSFEEMDEAAKTAEGKEPLSNLTFLPLDASLEDFSKAIASIDKINPADLQEFIWQLLIYGKSDFAYHIARYLEESHPSFSPKTTSWMFKLLVLGMSLGRADGEIAQELSFLYRSYDPALCYVEQNQAWNRVVRLLLIAACLKPVLFAPNTGASVVLRDVRLKGHLPQLYNLIIKLVELSNLGISIDPAMLECVRDEAAWAEQMKRLQDEVDDWIQQEKQSGGTLFSSATKVWKHLIKDGETIAGAISIISEDDTERLDEARQWIETYGVHANIDRKIWHTDRNIIKRKKGKKIEGKALEQVRSKFMHFRELLTRWINLHEIHPGTDRDYLIHHIHKVHDQIQAEKEVVLEEVQSFLETNARKSRSEYAACKVCFSALEDLFKVFDYGFSCNVKEPKVKNLLNFPAIISSVSIDPETWEPQALLGESFPRFLAESVVTSAYDVSSNFQKLCEIEDHEKTGFFIEHVKDMDLDVDFLDLQKQREDLIKMCRNELEESIAKTALEIEKAVALGILTEQERIDLESRRQKVELQKGDALCFPPFFQELDEIRSKVSQVRKQELKTARRKLSKANNIGKDDLARVNALLDEGDVHTGNEYIQLLMDGKDLPQKEKRRYVLEELIEKYEGIDEFLKYKLDNARKVSALVKSMEKHAQANSNISLGPVSMKDIRGNHARSAAELIKNWFDMKWIKNSNISQFLPKLEGLLEAMGFSNVTCERRERNENRVWVDMKARPLNDREICPVPQYGSVAGGDYSLLLVWDRPTEDALIGEVESKTTTPVIVLYFGRLSIRRRRELATLSRRRNLITFLVLDDVLLLFLCGETQLRLPALFAATLPFTYLSPYASTSGLVPPEMFFGRQNELKEIIDPYGSCFIFGGRQLGKTALLKDAERRFHNPDEGRIAIFLDLENNGIVLDRPINDIWRLIEGEMKKNGVISTKKQTNYDSARIGREIENWLAVDQKRRILLMIDEADRFLDYDGTEETDNKESGNFARTRRLKGWMENTKRRLKVVFAGLHNVQRTTRLANHPLAQFGTPICVGPLLNNGEMQQAKELVEFPLIQTGFRFEDQDLSMRILAQTNYYPSLIQIYGQQLLKHVNTPQNRCFPRTLSPPYILKSQHIEVVYQSQDLRSEIKSRFKLTLQLDTRYEVIAYAIAYECLAGDKDGITTGFRPSWIEEEVMNYWPEGFSRDNSDIPVRSLLEEMVGLGILREVQAETGETKYTLRSPNVLLLLGTEEEIMELLMYTERKLKKPYEASAFRPAYRGDEAGSGDKSRRNPLTCEQEGKIRAWKNGVSLVCGSEATGLYELSTFLQGEFPQFFEYVNDLQTKEFQKELDRLKKRQREGTTILFVDPGSAWPETWLDQAMDFTRSLKSKKSFARVVFAVEPLRLWNMIRSTSYSIFNAVDIIGLTPWRQSMLRIWLDVLGYQADKDKIERITSLTGNWPLCLTEFHRQNRENLFSFHEGLKNFENKLKDHEFMSRILSSFEVPKQLFGIMRIMADMNGPITTEELDELTENIPLEMLNDTMRWGRILSYISQESEDAFRLDPFLERILSQVSQEA